MALFYLLSICQATKGLYLGAGNEGNWSQVLVVESKTKEREVGPLHWGPNCPETTYTYRPSVTMPRWELAISLGVSNLSHHLLSVKLNTSTWEWTWGELIKVINLIINKHTFQKQTSERVYLRSRDYRSRRKHTKGSWFVRSIRQVEELEPTAFAPIVTPAPANRQMWRIINGR